MIFRVSLDICVSALQVVDTLAQIILRPHNEHGQPGLFVATLFRARPGDYLGKVIVA